MSLATPSEHRLDIAKDYHAIFTSETGTRVLTDLKHRGFYSKSIMVAPAPEVSLDVTRMLIHEGKRILVLEILAEIELGKRGIMPQARAIVTEPEEIERAR